MVGGEEGFDKKTRGKIKGFGKSLKDWGDSEGSPIAFWAEEGKKAIPASNIRIIKPAIFLLNMVHHMNCIKINDQSQDVQ